MAARDAFVGAQRPPKFTTRVVTAPYIWPKEQRMKNRGCLLLYDVGLKQGLNCGDLVPSTSWHCQSLNAKPCWHCRQTTEGDLLSARMCCRSFLSPNPSSFCLILYLTVYLGSYCQVHQGMQKERRKESHAQGGYYLSVADCIYFGGLEASCFWLSSCVLVLGYKFRSTRTKEKYGGI